MASEDERVAYAIESTEVLRAPRQMLATFGVTSIRYYLVTRPAYAEDESLAETVVRDGQVVADIEKYEKWKHLVGESEYTWRSGIKHDCAKVMELTKVKGGFKNGFDEKFDLETRYLYPMLKSSDVAKGEVASPIKWMLVTQKFIGENTEVISRCALKTWNYLNKYGQLLDKRKSVVYEKRSRFSIFGVGDYSFAKWKVAVSGLYKKLDFIVVPPFKNKPVMLDDTCYFLSFGGDSHFK